MRKAFRHSGVLMMAAVVALGLLGAAYTLWYEDLQVTAQVSTGNLDADVSIHPWNGSTFGAEQTANNVYLGAGRPVVAIFNTPSPLAPWQIFLQEGGYETFGNFPAGKPATTCDAMISNQGAPLTDSDGSPDSNALLLKMGGLYPYAGCEYLIDIHNGGTVPFHIAFTGATLEKCNNEDFTGCSPEAPAPWTLGIPADSSAQCIAFFQAIGSALPVQINYLDGNVSKPVQLHAGQELACRFKLVLDQFQQGAEGATTAENAYWQARFTYKAYQWNENPYGP